MRGLLCALLYVYSFILLARVLLSWIPRPPEILRPIVDFIFGVTEPIVRLARPLIPPVRIGMAALDLSILLVFFVLTLVQQVVCRAP